MSEFQPRITDTLKMYAHLTKNVFKGGLRHELIICDSKQPISIDPRLPDNIRQFAVANINEARRLAREYDAIAWNY